MNIIEEKLKNSDFFKNTKLKISVVIKLINFCMNNNIFTFNGQYFKQISGAPMGCKLSPIIAEALVSKIFEQAIVSYSSYIKLCKFYVDDSILIINRSKVDNFYEHINDIGKEYKNISFTIEREINSSLGFLEIKIIRLNNIIETSVHRKITHSNRYLNFYSNPIKIKKAIIKIFVTRALKYCTNSVTLDGELKLIENVLIQNNYPVDLIRKTISNAIEKFNNPNSVKYQFDLSRVVSIPFYNNVSNDIKNMLAKYNIDTVFKKGSRVQNILNNFNSESIFNKSNVVYNVNCTCGQEYFGQTKRNLGKRICEHRMALNRRSYQSDIAEHAIKTKHDINFDSPKIIYNESNNEARKFLESWSILKAKLNKKSLMNDKLTGSINIPDTYVALLK